MAEKTTSGVPIGCAGCLVVIAVVVVLYVGFCSNDSSTRSSAPPAPVVALPPSPKEQTRPLLTLTLRRWYKDGFGSIMMADFDIRNGSSHTVKDVTIKCTHSAPSGTEIDANTRTIYQTFPAQKTKAIRDFNMGFINEQARTTRCEITDFLLY